MAKTVGGSIWDVISGQKSAFEAEAELKESEKEKEEENASGMGLLARLNSCAENITNIDFDKMQQAPMLYGRDGGMMA